MRFVITTISILIVFTLSLKGFTQKKDLNFVQISEVNGQSLGKINAITMDSNGFLWLSDQSNRCIIRYDGSAMTSFQNDPTNSNSLGGYYPECLFADSSGVIWIGFYGQGLDRFDQKTNTFTHYNHDPNDPTSLSNNMISVVFVDRSENVWVGTNEGLNLLERESGTFKRFQHDSTDHSSLSHDVVRAIYEDRQGTLWIGTGFAYNFDEKGGLNKFHPESGKFTRYLHEEGNPNSLIDNKVRSIYEDSRGNFWIGTRGDGLHSMDRKTGKFTRYTYDPVNLNKLCSPPVKSRFSNVTFIMEDAENHLWIGSDASGLNRYNPETQSVTHYEKDNNNNLSSWCAFASNEGLVWFGGQITQGLSKVDLYSSKLKKNQNVGLVRSFQEDDSLLWMGIFGGLVKINHENGFRKIYENENNNTASLSSNDVRVIAKDKDVLWIGTELGLNKFDPVTEKFTRYQSDQNDSTSLKMDIINDIEISWDSRLWIATAGGGVDLFDPKLGIFQHHQSDPSDINSLVNDLVNVVFEESRERVWLGLTNNGGVNLFNPKTGKVRHYLPGFSIEAIHQDQQGTIWAGTTNGLFQYYKHSDTFSPSFGPNNDMMLKTPIRSIISDKKNIIWLGSAFGIYRLDLQMGNIVLHGKEKGVNGEILMPGSVFQLKNGNILFGEMNGYYELNPIEMTTQNGHADVFLSHLWLNDKEIDPSPHGPFNESIMEAKKISLDYDQNVFALSIASVDLRATANKEIYYTLENYDQGWRSIVPGQRANYFKVPPGKYTFKIKSSSSSNGRQVEKSIDLIIAPPWWRSFWAYILYGLLFLSGVFAVDRIQRKRLLAKERSNQKDKELAQAREIEKAYTELKATQSQLIQSEKMASLGELTAGIAHEIQNPLNFVNNFSEVNDELLDDLKDAIANNDQDEIEALYNDLKENEKKIKHHGQRAEGIVQGMLQHSRTSHGEKEATDINQLVDEYLRLAYHGMRAKDKSFNAEFRTDFDPNLPKINVVPQDIGRVLLNLINNAFYAVDKKARHSERSEESKEYQPEVVVLTKKLEKVLEVSVQDNGPGIPDEIIDKIFQPFFTTKPTGSGTGLGLSLSYDIVKAQGGELKVKNLNLDDEGSEFVISIPIIK